MKELEKFLLHPFRGAPVNSDSQRKILLDMAERILGLEKRLKSIDKLEHRLEEHTHNSFNGIVNRP